MLTELDAVGNTTKAITKGIAIATAVLAATALFGSFTDAVTTAVVEGRRRRSTAARRSCRPRRLNVAEPEQPGRPDHRRGGRVPVLRPGDQRGVPRGRRGRLRGAPPVPRASPGSWTAPSSPEYGKVVDICTRDSLRELATPGLLAVLAPIAVGFGLGVGAARRLPRRRDRAPAR